MSNQLKPDSLFQSHRRHTPRCCASRCALCGNAGPALHLLAYIKTASCRAVVESSSSCFPAGSGKPGSVTSPSDTGHAADCTTVDSPISILAMGLKPAFALCTACLLGILHVKRRRKGHRPGPASALEPAAAALRENPAAVGAFNFLMMQ